MLRVQNEAFPKFLECLDAPNLDRTEMGNRFANRFFWLCIRRSKFLPDGKRLPSEKLAPLSNRLKQALTTDIFGQSAIIPCFRSIVRETVWRRSCDPGMCTVLTAGKSCCCRRLSDSNRPGTRLGRRRSAPTLIPGSLTAHFPVRRFKR